MGRELPGDAVSREAARFLLSTIFHVTAGEAIGHGSPGSQTHRRSEWSEQPDPSGTLGEVDSPTDTELIVCAEEGAAACPAETASMWTMLLQHSRLGILRSSRSPRAVFNLSFLSRFAATMQL